MTLKRFIFGYMFAMPILLFLLLPLLISSVTIEKYQIKKKVPIK